MPIMALFRSSEINPSRYDAIMAELDVNHRPLEGILTHACGFDAKGICVMDVWESREDFETFLSERLKPAFAKLNLAFTPPQIIETYGFSAAERVDRYTMHREPGFGAGREAPRPGREMRRPQH